MSTAARIRKTMISYIAASVCAACLAAPACATEGGGGAYPNGAEDFMAGAVPPPGTYLINYLTSYSADRFTNNDGVGVVPNFKLDVTANVLRFIHVTSATILGASWAMHTLIPILNVDVTTPGGQQDRLGFGDVVVSPMILAWHSKNLHAVAAVDFYLPVGPYDKGRMANLGRNYWTIEPAVGVTYLGDSGLDVSAKLMYDINTINTATDYTSGNEFHMDYAVGQKIKQFTLGGAGYYYQQVSDDKINGRTIANNKGSAVAIGPAIKYDYQKAGFTLKYLFEAETNNRPDGGSLWFKFNYAF